MKKLIFPTLECQKLNKISHFAAGRTILFLSVRDVVLDTVDGFLHIILYAKTCNFRQPDVKKTTTHYWLSIDARQMKNFTIFLKKKMA